MAVLLDYQHVEVSFNGDPVVHDVSFQLHPGEILGLVGESGSGKSTLLKAAMGLLGSSGMVTRGDIWFEGKSFPDVPPKEMRRVPEPDPHDRRADHREHGGAPQGGCGRGKARRAGAL